MFHSRDETSTSAVLKREVTPTIIQTLTTVITNSHVTTWQFPVSLSSVAWPDMAREPEYSKHSLAISPSRSGTVAVSACKESSTETALIRTALFGPGELQPYTGFNGDEIVTANRVLELELFPSIKSTSLVLSSRPVADRVSRERMSQSCCDDLTEAETKISTTQGFDERNGHNSRDVLFSSETEDIAVGLQLASPSPDRPCATDGEHSVAREDKSVSIGASYHDWDVSSDSARPSTAPSDSTPPLATEATQSANVNSVWAIGGGTRVIEGPSVIGANDVEVIATNEPRNATKDVTVQGGRVPVSTETVKPRTTTTGARQFYFTDMAGSDGTTASSSLQSVKDSIPDSATAYFHSFPSRTENSQLLSSAPPNASQAERSREDNTFLSTTFSHNSLPFGWDASTDIELFSSRPATVLESYSVYGRYALSSSDSDVENSVSSYFDDTESASGDVEVIATTSNISVSATTISPTPASGVFFSGSLSPSSISGNGGLARNDDTEATGVSTLAIALPLCLAFVFFIGIIVGMSLLCYRRKKKKKGRKGSNNDLWVEPTIQQVPAISIALPSISDMDCSQSCASQEKADAEVSAMLNLESAELVEESETSKPRVSSFLIKKVQGDRSLKDSNSFNMGELRHQSNGSCAVPRSASALVPVASVKLTPVTPVRLNPVPPIRLTPETSVRMTQVSSALSSEDFSSSVKDKYFKALFSYKAAYRGELSLREGEIIQGKERDRNGWMLGVKVQTKEEGWFPAVYVDEVPEDFSAEKDVEHMMESAVTAQLDPDVYGLLAVNRNKSPDQSWVGIEHQAVKDYCSQSSTEISLRAGDAITVVEALQSGWCLGCLGDQVGWFPLDHVELLEEKSERSDDMDTALLPLPLDCQHLEYQLLNSSANNSGNVSPVSKRSSMSSSMDARDLLDRKPPHSLSHESMISAGGKLVPARKAPKPPASGSKQANLSPSNTTGTLSRNLRPVRPAPAPPSRSLRSQSVQSMDRLEAPDRRGEVRNWSVERLGVSGRQEEASSGGKNRQEKQPASPGGSMDSLEVSGRGWEVRNGLTMAKKQRKPRVVRIPKEKLGLDKISSCPPPKEKPRSVSDNVSTATSSLHSHHQQGGIENDLVQKLEDFTSVTCSETTSSSSETGGNSVNNEQLLEKNDELSSLQANKEVLTNAVVAIKQEGAHSASVTTKSSSEMQDVSIFSAGVDLVDINKYSLSGTVPISCEDNFHSEESSLNAMTSTATTPTLTVSSTSFPEADSKFGDAGYSEIMMDEIPKFSPAFQESDMIQEEGEITSQYRNSIQKEAKTSGNYRLGSQADINNSNLSDHFQSHLMSTRVSPSPDLTSRHSLSPSVHLEETEVSAEDRTKSAGSPRTSGYWKFHSSSRGEDSGQKPVKLTKVAPPVVPNAGTVDHAEEATVLAVPPAGTSGRVHKIVNQFNRMTSIEEQQAFVRKTSFQSDSPAEFSQDLAHANNTVDHSSRTEDSNKPIQNPLNQVQENPDQEHSKKLANGGPMSFHTGVILPVLQNEVAEDPSNREATSESEDELQAQSIERLQASPSPSSSRSLKMLAMTIEDSSEC